MLKLIYVKLIVSDRHKFVKKVCRIGSCTLETSRTVLVSIRTALLTNIKFGEGCLFFAMSIVKIRLQKVRLNFHRRNGPDVSRG